MVVVRVGVVTEDEVLKQKLPPDPQKVGVYPGRHLSHPLPPQNPGVEQGTAHPSQPSAADAGADGGSDDDW